MIHKTVRIERAEEQNKTTNPKPADEVKNKRQNDWPKYNLIITLSVNGRDGSTTHKRTVCNIYLNIKTQKDWK